MSVSPEKPFSPLREKLWPIHRDEVAKFIPMVVMMFSILFNYTLVRNIKDTLLMNAPGADKDVLSFVKIAFVLPSSLLFVVLYAKLDNILKPRALYYSCLLPFAIFFAVYGFILYPMRDVLHASPQWIESMKESYPSLKSLWAAGGNWSYTLFYVISELWGNIGVTILFWQFANKITAPNEAKRFYPMFGFWSNLGLVCAGLLVIYTKFLSENQQIYLYSAILVFSCGLVGLGYFWMQTRVLSNPKFQPVAVKKKSKPKLSVGESLRLIAKSSYLRYMAILVIAYGVTINILEVTWKGQVMEYCKETYGDHRNIPSLRENSQGVGLGSTPSESQEASTDVARVASGEDSNTSSVEGSQGSQVEDRVPEGMVRSATGELIPEFGKKRVQDEYSRYFAWTLVFLGLATMFFIVFSKGLLEKFSWRLASAITPLVILVSGVIFYVFVIFSKELSWISRIFGVSTLKVTVLVGSIQNVLSKGIKYALFDPTREMAYIPLDDEMKSKGKAAVDVIGGRLGKSGGGALQTALQLILGKKSMAPYLFVCLVGLCLFWLSAVKSLSFLYGKQLKDYEKEEA